MVGETLTANFDYYGLGTQFGKAPEKTLRSIMQKLPDNAIVLEIGSWVGTSACIMASEIGGRGGRIFCVDKFTGNGEDNVYLWETEKDKIETVFDRFLRNRNALGYNNVVFPLYMPSYEAGIITRDEIFDFVFIDGDHRYEQVKADILRWRRTVKHGGMMGGHDYECRMSEAPVDWATYKHDHVNPVTGEIDCYETGFWPHFHMFHPGVIRAVDEAFGDKVQYENTVWWVNV